MSKYHEPWSQGEFMPSDAIEGIMPPEEVINKINETRAKQVYVQFKEMFRQRIAITNDPLIAKRITLCVNACKGLTDEALERNIVNRGVRLLWDKYEEASCCLNDDMETSVWEATDGE